MKTFLQSLQDNEEWLMERILMYAEKTGYTTYTSTLKEAWRLSISGLSSSIAQAAEVYSAPPVFSPEFDFVYDPIAQFGVLEAQKHRKRGISLAMFLGLFKYYRQTYIDLLDTIDDPAFDKKQGTLYLDRVFDIIEISLSVEWAGGADDQIIINMQAKNREMTNEKNKYLTIFESLPHPIFLVDQDGTIGNMNHAAAKYFKADSVAGGHYYKSPINDSGQNAERDEENLLTTSELLPWLHQEMEDFKTGNLTDNPFVRNTTINEKDFTFRVRIAAMLDVSHKFDGMILLLEDITQLDAAEKEVKTLAGLIPICSHCKKMRDDKGYWNRLENYIEDRSDALFSHSICDSCVDEHYSEIMGKLSNTPANQSE